MNGCVINNDVILGNDVIVNIRTIHCQLIQIPLCGAVFKGGMILTLPLRPSLRLLSNFAFLCEIHEEENLKHVENQKLFCNNDNDTETD